MSDWATMKVELGETVKVLEWTCRRVPPLSDGVCYGCWFRRQREAGLMCCMAGGSTEANCGPMIFVLAEDYDDYMANIVADKLLGEAK